MTDSQKAAQEIAEHIVGLGADTNEWSMTRDNGDLMDEYDRGAILERIRQIIDRHLC
jgi:hypothetical protein